MTFSEEFEIYWRDYGVRFSIPIMELAFKEVAYNAWSARICTRPHAPHTPNDCDGFVLCDGKLVPLDNTSLQPAWMREAITFLFDDGRISATKVIRNASGLTLKDSLLIVTHLERNYKLGVYDPKMNSMLAQRPVETLTPFQFALYHRFVTLIEAEYSELLDK
jgi:hypothetical protein